MVKQLSFINKLASLHTDNEQNMYKSNLDDQCQNGLVRNDKKKKEAKEGRDLRIE